MPTVSSNFKGHDYTIDENDQLTVNGELVLVIKTEEGKYFTQKMPYQLYDDLTQLAEHLIDKISRLHNLLGGDY